MFLLPPLPSLCMVSVTPESQWTASLSLSHSLPPTLLPVGCSFSWFDSGLITKMEIKDFFEFLVLICSQMNVWLMIPTSSSFSFKNLGTGPVSLGISVSRKDSASAIGTVFGSIQINEWKLGCTVMPVALQFFLPAS